MRFGVKNLTNKELKEGRYERDGVTRVLLPSQARTDYQKRVDQACRLDRGDGAIIAQALGEIAREIGVIQVTGAAGLERTSFYRTFNGKTDPRLSTITKLVRALGLKIVMS